MNAIFKRKKVAKFNFKITVQHLMKLPKSGIILYITWKRGKKHRGETKKAFVKDKTAVWEEDIQFKGTLFKNSKGKYKKKCLDIYIHEVVRDRKKKGEIGHLSINLADFSSLQMDAHSETRTFPVSLWGGSVSGELKVKIESEPRLKSDPNDLTTFDDNTTMTDATEENSDDEFDTKKKSSNNDRFRDKELDYEDDELEENEFEEEKGFDDEENNFHDDDDLRSGGGSDHEEDVEQNTVVKLPTKKPAKDDLDSDNEEPEEEEEVKPLPKPTRISAFDRRANLTKNNTRRNQNLSLTSELDSDAFLKNLEKTNESIQQRQKRKTPKETIAPSPRNTLSDEGSFTGDDHSSGHDEELEKAKRELAIKEQQKKEMEEKLAKLQKEQNQTKLIEVAITNKTPEFEKEVAISAPIVYKALKYWDCFTPGNNQLLPKITKALQAVIQRNERDQKAQCYWLAVCLNLLALLQEDFPISHAQEHGINIDILKRVDFNTINAGTNGAMDDVLPPTEKVVEYRETLQKVYQVVTTSEKQKGALITGSQNSNMNEDDFAFESPVSQFKNDLLGLIHNIYSQYFHDVVRQLLPILFEALFGKHGQPSQVNGPNRITKVLTDYFNLFKTNHISKSFTEQFFAQVFYFVNTFGFNALVSPKKRKFCTMGGAIMLKMCVSTLEEWAYNNKFEFSSPKNTKHILPLIGVMFLRQCADVLIMNKAFVLTTREEVCPVLSAIQLRKILESYEADDYDPDEIPSSVFKTFDNTIPVDKKAKYLLDSTCIFKPDLEKLPQDSSAINIMNDNIFQNRLPKDLADEGEFAFLTQ